MELSRRCFIRGLASTLAAPAIVRFDSIMPVKAIVPVKLYPPVRPFRELLLPGLWQVAGDYAMVERQWDKVFKT